MTGAVEAQMACAILLAAISAYIGGRVHERRRGQGRRGAAFRAGYLHATMAVTVRTAAVRRPRRRAAPVRPGSPGHPNLSLRNR